MKKKNVFFRETAVNYVYDLDRMVEYYLLDIFLNIISHWWKFYH